MNMKDGYAMKAATDAGYRIVIISGSKSLSGEKRLQNLGAKDIYFGVEDKEKKVNEMMAAFGLKSENVLYMGDDIPDYPAMKLCAVPTCPADAATEIKSVAVYVSDKKGGQGCVRDVIEQVMRLHGKWFKV